MRRTAAYVVGVLAIGPLVGACAATSQQPTPSVAPTTGVEQCPAELSRSPSQADAVAGDGSTATLVPGSPTSALRCFYEGVEPGPYTVTGEMKEYRGRSLSELVRAFNSSGRPLRSMRCPDIDKYPVIVYRFRAVCPGDGDRILPAGSDQRNCQPRCAVVRSGGVEMTVNRLCGGKAHGVVVPTDSSATRSAR